MSRPVPAADPDPFSSRLRATTLLFGFAPVSRAAVGPASDSARTPSTCVHTCVSVVLVSDDTRPGPLSENKVRNVCAASRGIPTARGGGRGGSVVGVALWLKAGVSGREPMQFACKYVQLAPCCYDNGTQLQEFAWN